MKAYTGKLVVPILTILFAVASIAAESPKLPDNYPQLVAPDRSDPRFGAYLTWHQAVLANDFDSYQALSAFPSNYTEDLKRGIFGEIQKFAPERVKVGQTKETPTGGLQFTAVGCKDNKRYVSIVTVVKVEGVWRVSGSGWGPPWNSSRDICPV